MMMQWEHVVTMYDLPKTTDILNATESGKGYMEGQTFI